MSLNSSASAPVGWQNWRHAFTQGNALARRVLLQVILFSSAVTAGITAIELYGDYRRDLRAIDGTFHFVGTNYLPSLIHSVWNIDDIQVRSQLDALMGLPDVEYMEVLENGRPRWSAGRQVSQRTKDVTLPLYHPAAPQPIGELRVVASVDRVLERVWARLLNVLLANAVKTLLVAGFLLWCFQVLVTQHLSKLARHLRNADLHRTTPPPPFSLDRPAQGRWRPDILDTVVDALNELNASQYELREKLQHSQDELARSEAWLRLGLEASGAGLWDWDIERRSIDLGEDCLDILGWNGRPTGATGYDDWERQIHPDDLPMARETLQAHFADRAPDARFTLEIRMLTSGGAWRWISWRGRLVERRVDGAPRRARGSIVNIDQRKLAEAAVLEMNRLLEQRVHERTAALEQARDEAERANLAKTEFLSRMSHELRTPLNAILGFSQLLCMPRHDPTVQRWGHEMHRAGQHLLKLIEDLLDLSRIEVGKLQVHLDAVDLRTEVQEAVGFVQAAQAHGNVEFVSHLDAGLPPVVVDPLRLRQILVNLLTNAAKYTPGGGRVIIGASRKAGAGARVRLSVTDQGIGIPRNQIDRLFRPFERLGRESTNIEGTGVGLALCKRLAGLMGCELGVHSTEGKGSTFWLDMLPAHDGAHTRRTELTLTLDEQSTRPLQLLYVEDNETNRLLMQAFFETHSSWTLLLADDGESGVAMARAHRPDIILLDLHLPDIDGYETLRRLRADALTREIPVIALTADAKPEQRDHGLRSGFTRYLAKPVAFAELVSVLESLKLDTLQRDPPGLPHSDPLER